MIVIVKMLCLPEKIINVVCEVREEKRKNNCRCEFIRTMVPEYAFVVRMNSHLQKNINVFFAPQGHLSLHSGTLFAD